MKKKRVINCILVGLLATLFLGVFTQKAEAADVRLLYKMWGLHTTVVQQTVIQKHNAYALQRVGTSAAIRKAKLPKHGNKLIFSPKHELLIKGVGHTQTWVNLGSGKCLVGSHPLKSTKWKWATELTRVSFPKKRRKIVNIKRYPHLTDLNYASDAPAANLLRAEAAVSPNKKYLLIATVDQQSNGHFALYDLKKINNLLNNAELTNTQAVSLRGVPYIAAFHVNHMFGRNTNQLDSIQGYDVDNNKNIYISSQLAPSFVRYPEQIIKFNWGNTDMTTWKHINLKSSHWKHIFTELEGLKLSSRKLQLTVACHRPGHPKRLYKTLGSDLYIIKHI